MLERQLHGISYEVSGLDNLTKKKMGAIDKLHWLMQGFKTLELFVIIVGCVVQMLWMKESLKV